MSIRVTRLSDHGVNLTVYCGRLTRDEILTHYCGLSAEDGAAAQRWISYFDPSTDLSEIDPAAFPEMKRVLTAKLLEIYPHSRLVAAMVCDSRVNQPMLSFWRSYVGADAEHPSDSGLFPSLKQACDWLGLSDAAFLAVASAVRKSNAEPAVRRAPTGARHRVGA